MGCEIMKLGGKEGVTFPTCHIWIFIANRPPFLQKVEKKNIIICKKERLWIYSENLNKRK